MVNGNALTRSNGLPRREVVSMWEVAGRAGRYRRARLPLRLRGSGRRLALSAPRVRLLLAVRERELLDYVDENRDRGDERDGMYVSGGESWLRIPAHDPVILLAMAGRSELC